MSDCKSESPQLVVAIGGSAGSLQVIREILQSLPESFLGAIVIATHRAPARGNPLADILSWTSRVAIAEPIDENCLECAKVYVGRAKDRVEVNQSEFDVEEDMSPYARIRRIDDLFTSVAESSKENAVGVILSGMLSDGVKGLQAIHQAGGVCIVQDPDEADYSSMPEHAIAKVAIDYVATAKEITSLIVEFAACRGLLQSK